MRRVLLALILSSLAFNADAQQLAAVITRDLTPGESQEAVGSLLALRLSVELEERGYQLYDTGDASSGQGDSSEPRVTRIDVGDVPGNLDLIVAAFYRVEGGAIVIQFVLIDPVVDIVVGGVLSRQRAGLNTSTSVVDAIAELRPALERWEADRSLLRTGPPPDTVERILVYGSQEDVRVRFADFEVGTVRAGRIVVPYSPFPVGSTVPMTLSKAGYHEREVEVTLSEARVETTLPSLFPSSSIGLSALWTSSYVAGAGVGIRAYLAPDLFYVLGEFYRFMNPGPDGRPVRASDMRAAAGLYMLAPESFLRGFVEVGGGFLATDVEVDSGSRLADDPVYRDVFVGVSAGIEINTGRWKPFLRADVDYALGFTRYNLLGNRWISPPLTALPIPVPMATIGVQRTW